MITLWKPLEVKISMGNKQGKTRTSATSSKGKAADGVAAQANVPAPAPAAVGSAQQRKVPPPAPVQQTRMHPVLENKLSMVDVTMVFSPHEIQAIRKHLTSILGQQESESIVIPKDEFYRFLGATTSSLYVNRLYAIFDMAGKGNVSHKRSSDAILSVCF